MLNFQVIPTPAELKEAAAIERRRRNEEIRRCRIFDPKARLFGLDLKALDEQVREKQRREEEERRISLKFEEQRIQEDQAIILLQRQAEKEKRQLIEDIDRFRQCYQKITDRREYDLNDPDCLKKERPIRVDDDDPTITPSSIQKFEGEDLCKPERLKLQAEQKRAWYLQQIRERQRAEEDRCRAEIEYQKALIARDNRACQLEGLERECRKRLEQIMGEFNRALANEIECRRKVEEKEDQEDSQAHMYNVITSDIMTENRECGYSNLGPSRILPTLYRGLSEEQKQEIRNQQLRQAEEKKCALELERRKEEEWASLSANLARSAELKERELNRRKKLLEEQLARENEELGQLHREQRARIEASYENKPTCDYFNQFGTSTR